jgi:hypothetical protein
LAAIARSLAGPIRDTALRQCAAGARRHIESPDLFAGSRIQCEDAVLGWEIHHAVDHNRRYFGQPAEAADCRARAVGAVRHAPCQLQLSHVAGIDLLEWRKSRARQIMAKHRPICCRIGPLCSLLRFDGLNLESTATRLRQNNGVSQ